MIKDTLKRAISSFGRPDRRAPSKPPSPQAPVAAQEPVLLATHHSIFRRFRPWSGQVPPGFLHTSFGSLIRKGFSHSAKVNGMGYAAQGAYPVLTEEYFEWIDLLEALSDAKSHFVMAELGAGYGRWCVAAACAARYNLPELSIRLIAVEAEPSHFEMLKQHFLDNGLAPEEHRLLQAAVNGEGGEVSFPVGHASEWWGQAIIPAGARFGNWPEAREVRIQALRLDEVLEGETLVDLIDMDIQGAEAGVVTSSLPILNERVRRLHIGTHSHSIEDQIYQTLKAEGWHCGHAFRCNSTVETHYGHVEFGDGVQSWLNPRLF